MFIALFILFRKNLVFTGEIDFYTGIMGVIVLDLCTFTAGFMLGSMLGG